MKSRRARVLTALAAVAATTAAVLAVEPGYHASQVRMLSGAVWLASARTGQTTLVDGATAEVAARVQVAAPGSPLSVTQQGGTAHVLNRATGELKRVDAATEQVSEPVTVLPAGDGLALIPTPRRLYEIDVHSGLAASVDPHTMTGDAPKPLVGQIRLDGLVADDRDRLWAIDHQSGDLVWLTGQERRTRPAATRPGSSRLAITKNQPALVDPERRTAELLDPDTGAAVRSVRPDLRPGDPVVVSGSADRSRLLIVSGGALVVCAFDTGSCAAPVVIGSPGGDLGTPVEVHDHAVVPDYSTGQAVIVDLATSRVVAQRQLFDQPTRFELLARDGIVFFNDPDGNKAGVLGLAGEIRTITKYTDEHSEGDTAPDHRAQEGKPVGFDGKNEKPGLGMPGQPIQPARTNPAPTPSAAASIVVRPGNQGVVGDELELTLLLGPSTGVATTRWWFGDGTEATGTTVRHRWQQPGTFTVRAATTLDTGAQGPSAQTAVTMVPAGTPPHITRLDVRRPRPVIGETVHFGADSTGKPDRWAWTITRLGAAAPEVTARSAEFDHVFSAPGTYTVALTVTEGTQVARSSRQFTVARGIVRAWGWDAFGQLEVPVEATTGGVVAVDSGIQHSLALKSDGSVLAWGSKDQGATAVPVQASSGVIAIAAAATHSLALKSDGSVLAWGRDTEGQTAVPPEAQEDVIGIAGGNFHSLALKADGSVIGWGQDAEDQISVPPGARSGVIAIAASSFHSVALKSDGSVVAWGDNSFGQTTVPPSARSGVVAIAAGDDYTLALKADGSVVGWGNDHYGQATPPPSVKDVIGIDAGVDHSVALKADGTVVGWGSNYEGESSVPHELNRGVLAVAGGGYFNVIII